MDNQELPIRPATSDDWEAISRLLFSAFNEAYEEEQSNADRGIFEPERSLVVTDRGRFVGHAATFTRDLTVPGALVPAAHVTMVGVAPTHRRRGILRRLMHRQLREVRDAGREPIAILWASEGRIYQRFGYGLATTKLAFDIDAREVRLADPAPAVGTLRDGEPAAVQTELAKVYEQMRADHPGWSSRDARWWEHVLTDLPSRRHGTTELRAILHEGQSGVDGYALWRVKGSWDGGGPSGEVTVAEAMATNPSAYVAVWRFLLSVDLTRSTRFWFGAPDEPLLYLANEPRRLGSRLGDGLWLRIVDVAAALAARRYAAPVDVVIEVRDDLITENAGRWQLTDGAAERTDAAADLVCDISVLGAAYLGGTSLGALAAAGRVEERTPGALAAADTALGWHRAPSSIEVF